MRISKAIHFDRIWLACLFALGMSAANLKACTLWGVVYTNASGGTILSKNRDWKPDHTQVLKMNRSGKGYAYFGLYAVGGTEPGIKEGVNEKGLTVVTASASSIPQSKRDNQPGKHSVISKLLSGYASCDEVLAKKDEIFPVTRAMFIMISDRAKILVVEVGLEGQYAIKTIENGTAVHTNHFLEEKLAGFNTKIGTSSAMRLDRIIQLMKTASAPHTIDSFSKISRDQHAGPDNSLWRTGQNGSTLSSWIIETPARDIPKLRVVIANPGQKEETHTFVLDQKFWSEQQ
ncbi:MAG: carcinine hydrolase/isopenicillin-N N-acyltransferase family protein [bacterium]